MIQKGIIVNPGQTLKHLVYVDDLCRAFDLAIRTPHIEGEIFIIAGREPIPLRTLIEIGAEGLGVPPPKVRLPAWPFTSLFALVETGARAVGTKPPVFRRSMDFFTKSVSLDVRKARDVLGFQGEVEVPIGVARTIAWYRENHLL
jgi:nucleoside-diphosphate-sugar epimerase